MYQNALTLNLEYLEQPQELNLRLSIASQLKLKKETGEEGVELIFKAIDDLGLQIKLFTEALNFKGHQNVITDGAVLYEVLVDNGYSGKEQFARLLFDIASSSGIIKPDQAEKLGETIDNMYARMFSSLENAQFDSDSDLEEKDATFRKIENINA